MKSLILSLLLALSFSVHSKVESPSRTLSPERYVMIIFHGMGAPQDKTFQEAKDIPDLLRDGGVERLFNTAHKGGKANFKKMLELFNCQNGIQKNEDLGLIVLGYSWGARRNYEFSKFYEKNCGRKADRGYMIDGIQKLVSQFKKGPIATHCKNYYKTIKPVRGTAVENCENFDYTDKACKNRDGTYMSGWNCHQATLQSGFESALNDISKNGLYY
ncbi:MAG: hypothetical protein ACO20H_10390 [Bacteriovoracaceae bacterium]